MNILGINSVYHESAAAVLVDGALVAAVEEERFNRIKHGKEANVDNPQQFPEHDSCALSGELRRVKSRRHAQVCLSSLTRRAAAVVEASDGDGRRRATEQGRRCALGRALRLGARLSLRRRLGH